MVIFDDIKYVGVNDFNIDLFESQYRVPHGMAYNSYVILDEKTAVMDTADAAFGEQWQANVQSALAGRQADYLVVTHMEPDHSANIALFMKKNTQTKIVSSAAAFRMMVQFFGTDFAERKVVVGDKAELDLGTRKLRFFTAPMVHWPEVVMAYDTKRKVLFSADAFGKFGAVDEKGEASDWVDEARRYYFGIVGKYGDQVQALLKKLVNVDVEVICSLHGPVLRGDLSCYLKLYDTWSSYTPETKGVFIAYTSVYGHTKEAALLLQSLLKEKGVECVAADLSRADKAECLANAFRYDKLVLASTTYSMTVFPSMNAFIDALVEHNYKKRRVAIIENGSWAPLAAKAMKGKIEKLDGIEFAKTLVTIKSSLNDSSRAKLQELASELVG